MNKTVFQGWKNKPKPFIRAKNQIPLQKLRLQIQLRQLLLLQIQMQIFLWKVSTKMLREFSFNLNHGGSVLIGRNIQKDGQQNIKLTILQNENLTKQSSLQSQSLLYITNYHFQICFAQQRIVFYNPFISFTRKYNLLKLIIGRKTKKSFCLFCSGRINNHIQF